MALIALDDIIPGKPRSGETPAPSGARPVVRKDATPEKAPLDPLAESMRGGHPIEGGFTAVREDLERRSREWTNMVRLLDQHRQQLEAAEKERDAAYLELARLMPTVQDTARDFKTAMERCKAGERGIDLAGLCARNGAALQDLEKVVGALNSQFLSCRSAWEQYARTVVNAQRLRSEMRASSASDQRP